MIRQFFCQIKILSSKSYHQETIVDAVVGDSLEFVVVVDNEHKFGVAGSNDSNSHLITDQKNGLLYRVGKDFGNQAVLDVSVEYHDDVRINVGFVDSIDRPRFELDKCFRNGFDLYFHHLAGQHLKRVVKKMKLLQDISTEVKLRKVSDRKVLLFHKHLCNTAKRILERLGIQP